MEQPICRRSLVVKIPMVMPSITICIFPDAVKQFQIIDQNLSLTAGAPSHKTENACVKYLSDFLW